MPYNRAYFKEAEVMLYACILTASYRYSYINSGTPHSHGGYDEYKIFAEKEI